MNDYSVYQDLSTKVYNILREMIFSGELGSGQKLVQEELAKQLGVSRTPLIQAISKLSKDHLVEIIPRRGAYVRNISSKEILDAFSVRCAIEPLAAELAVQNAADSDIQQLEDICNKFDSAVEHGSESDIRNLDCAFHLEICRLSDNRFINDFMRTVINSALSFEFMIKQADESSREHRAILALLKDREPLGAKRAMGFHMNDGLKNRLEGFLGGEEE